MPSSDPTRSARRMPQQQPARDSDPQQQRAGGADFQPRSHAHPARDADNDPDMERDGREARERARRVR